MDIILPDGRPFQMLSNIQHLKASVPVAGAQVSIPITVTPTKCVVMLYGNNRYADPAVPYAWEISPLYTNFLPTQISIEWAHAPNITATVGITILEYI